MTKSKTPAQQKAAKRSGYLRSIGRPTKVDAQRTYRHIVWLHDVHGMPLGLIGQLGGLAEGSINDIRAKGARGETYEVYRKTQDGILRVQPMDLGGSYGAHVDMTGTMRRLNCLTYQGFTLQFIADQIDMAIQNLSPCAKGQVRFVFAGTARKVKEIFGKLDGTKPFDYGIEANSQRIAIFYSKKRGGTPSHVWDEDTIDNPQALPEWTGACGSILGYHLHIRHSLMPACEPCLSHHRAQVAEVRARAKGRSDRANEGSGVDVCAS